MIRDFFDFDSIFDVFNEEIKNFDKSSKNTLKVCCDNGKWYGTVSKASVDENGKITCNSKNVEADNLDDFDKKFNEAVDETFNEKPVKDKKENCPCCGNDATNLNDKISSMEKQIKELNDKISAITAEKNKLNEENNRLNNKIGHLKNILGI